jgi:hypothetical protein
VGNDEQANQDSKGPTNQVEKDPAPPTNSKSLDQLYNAAEYQEPAQPSTVPIVAAGVMKKAMAAA